MLWPEVTDNYRLNTLIGASNLLYWLSIYGYYLYSHDYDKLPITMLYSAKYVMEGLVSILPLCLGVAVFINVLFYEMHQYKTPAAALFTMFYLYGGDT